MCGRSRCTLDPDRVAAATGVEHWVDGDDATTRYEPSHNVSPGHVTIVERRVDDKELVVQPMRWGLVPSYTKPDVKPDHFRMFNARSDDMKPVFTRLLKHRRCVVLLDGFYEWKKDGSKKQPFYVNMGEGNVMCMAGLYDTYRDAAGALHYTYTILTVDSSNRLEWLHNRMPVLLPTAQARDAWLAPEEDFQPSAAYESPVTLHGLELGRRHLDECVRCSLVAKLCQPYDGEDLVWHAVDPAMGSVKVQGPQCSRPQSRPSAAAFFKPRKPKEAPGAADAAAGTGGTPVEGKSSAGNDGLPVNTDESVTAVKKEEVHDAAIKAEFGAAEANDAPTPPRNGDSAAVNGNPAMPLLGDKRMADDECGKAADMPASKKPKQSAAKQSPAKQSALEKAATSKGQRTMSSFFSKKPV